LNKEIEKLTKKKRALATTIKKIKATEKPAVPRKSSKAKPAQSTEPANLSETTNTVSQIA
jgi:hypothetical protein